MIDKKISLGTLLTLGTIVGTFIYTQGVFATKMETYENENADKDDILEKLKEREGEDLLVSYWYTKAKKD